MNNAQHVDSVPKHRSSRRKRTMEEELKLDEIIAEFLNKMKRAAEKDVQMHSKNQPAIHKHQLLPKFVDMISRQDMHDLLLDNQILDGIRIWLEPFPDGVLPNLDIRTSLLESLQSLPIDRIHLKESKLGKIIMYLYKNPRETRDNRKLARQLIEKWSRPIVGNSTDHRDALPLKLLKKSTFPRNSFN